MLEKRRSDRHGNQLYLTIRMPYAKSRLAALAALSSPPEAQIAVKRRGTLRAATSFAAGGALIAVLGAILLMAMVKAEMNPLRRPGGTTYGDAGPQLRVQLQDHLAKSSASGLGASGNMVRSYTRDNANCQLGSVCRPHCGGRAVPRWRIS